MNTLSEPYLSCQNRVLCWLYLCMTVMHVYCLCIVYLKSRCFEFHRCHLDSMLIPIPYQARRLKCISGGSYVAIKCTKYLANCLIGLTSHVKWVIMNTGICVGSLMNNDVKTSLSAIIYSGISCDLNSKQTLWPVTCTSDIRTLLLY